MAKKINVKGKGLISDVDWIEVGEVIQKTIKIIKDLVKPKSKE